jgi:hypothetical protein
MNLKTGTSILAALEARARTWRGLSRACVYFALFSEFANSAQTVAFYHFDNTNGEIASTIVDSGPLGLNGSMVGTAHYAPGVLGGCIDLSGDFNYVTIPQSSSLVFSNSWTVELFFRANSPYTVYGSDPSCVINKLNTSASGNFLDSFHLQIGSAGIIYGQIGFGNETGVNLITGSQQNLSDGQWHHVGLVYKVGESTPTNTISLYVDYARASSVSGIFPPIVWQNFPIDIGAGNYPNEQDKGPFRRNFDGQVDEVRISSAALTPSEFVSLPPGHYTPLTIQQKTGGVLLSWGSLSPETYQLQTRSDLTLGTWSNLQGPQTGTGSRMSLPDPFVVGRTQSFYQLLVSP